MAYFKINNIDFSNIVNELKINKENTYSAQTNAAGNTVVDLINAKRTIEVGIIPIDSADMIKLQTEIDKVNVNISFLNPLNNALVDNISCIIPNNSIEYYTIQDNKVLYKPFSLSFSEL